MEKGKTLNRNKSLNNPYFSKVKCVDSLSKKSEKQKQNKIGQITKQ